jgi:subtilisin family serine protease
MPFTTAFFRRARRALLAATLAVAAAPAHAQLGLPRATLPTLPRDLPRLPAASASQALQPLTSPQPLQSLRLNTVRALLRDHRDVLEADPAGEPVRRGELLLIAPAQASLDAVLAAGFVLLREQALPELELRQLVLRPPPGMSTADALARLRAIDPLIDADFNHVYTRSGEAAGPAPIASATAGAAAPTRRVGLVDSGIARDHAAFRGADLRTWGCDDRPVPSPHGTAVASLLIGRDDGFAGVVPGSVLYAADIYCGDAAGGAVERIAQALAWLAREGVGVVNISLVGPANRLLERTVQALHRRGHVIVAAVGNDGPAAPPLYPASYPGAVGVTAVMPTRRVLPEAAQGPQVMFAAPGAELAVARVAGGYVVARGTSFAAPLVAGLLAESLPAPDVAAAAAALQRVTGSAIDLGAPGRDPVFGRGLVGEGARVAPDRVQARLH